MGDNMSNGMRFDTDYYTIYIKNGGRSFEVVLDPSIKKGFHHQALARVVELLHDEGVDSINADHLSYPWLDRRLDVRRGNRKLDIVYLRDGVLYECELKTHREVGIDRTWEQIKEQLKYCTNYFLYVPSEDLQYVRETLKIRGLNGVNVEPYD